jgi:exodeoxyribonuclease V beta subunit
MSTTGELALDLPLRGVRRIEASAGTGKTFTLALLHTRLVIERELSVRQILAVTYTNAATQELRERLRVQLERAAQLAALSPAERTQRSARADAAERLTSRAIEARLADEPAATLVARLRRAAGDIDLAAIFTIHGFCQRTLADHAVLGGEPLAPREMLPSERALHEEVAFDVWRRWTRDDIDATDLLRLWSAPPALARDLPALLRADVLLPVPAAPDADSEVDLTRATALLRASWDAHGVDACAAIEQARSAKILHGNKLRKDTVDKLWLALSEFCADATSEAPADERLAYLTPAQLRERANAGRAHEVPHSPLFDAIEAFLAAQEAFSRARAQRRANLLHAVRDYAAARIAELKRMRGLVGFDDLIGNVHAALTGPAGDAFATLLRDQYPVALVDEFQDTDPRQWEIFRRIYVGAAARATGAALFLIGDPKQAIYRFRGGDVHTYHAAAASADSTDALSANFRSRPHVLDAIAQVFARGGEFPFADAMTTFAAVVPGGNVDDRDFRRADVVAPGLTLWALPLRDGDTTRPSRTRPQPQIKVDAARRLAAAASAARIRDLLADAGATLGAGMPRRVLPGDIAVLVNTHREAETVQAALAAVGVPSVTAGRSSLYATREAEETLRLLEGLDAPSDEGRMRAALATVLLGQDAAAIDALSADEATHRGWLDHFQQWQRRWERLGPLPMLADRIAAAAPRLLALADGERRLSNYLQLAEHLQEARSRVLGAAGLIDWLAERIGDADDRDETQQLRLESDAERVQILTLHKAKGLEFALVLLPFAALPPSPQATRGLGLLQYHDGDRRVLRARIDGLDDIAYQEAKQLAARETRAEQLRLLYVGLTRARHALWLAHGAVNEVERSGLAWLLHRGADDDVAAVDDAQVQRALAELAAAAPQAIACETFPDIDATRWDEAGARAPETPPPLRIARRVLRQDWWMHSFSQLAREEGVSASEAERGAGDEGPPAPGALSPFAGARFGNALHTALETVDFSVWRDARGEQLPPAQGEILRAALAEHGYAGDDLASGERVLGALVRATLTTRLPEGVRLADLPPRARRSELEFHFAIGSVALPALFELLHRHALVRDRSSFGTRERLQGLMTGFIDLVYEHEERVYLLDYKSNQLADYGAAGLQQAMRAHEYDLQYLIYTLAVHRWLRFRRAGYDYERDFGGVRYLFCRGLAASGDEAREGVFAALPPRALIDELDALFAPPQGAAA